jgi:hypothetical protein
MPRKAPKEVIEHRITFGDYERKELRDAINAYQGDKIAENIPNYLLGGAGVVAAGALGLAAYAFWRWCDLGLLKDVVEDVWDKAKEESLNLASALGLGPSFIMRVRIELSSMKTEEEVLAYVNPLIAKIEADIRRLEDGLPGGDLTAGFAPNLIESRKKTLRQLESARDDALRLLASRGGAPEFRRKYGMGAVMGRFEYVYRTDLGNQTPPCNDPAARETFRDAFTTFVNEQLVAANEGASPENVLYYEPPTGTYITSNGVECVDVKGELYTLSD